MSIHQTLLKSRESSSNEFASLLSYAFMMDESTIIHKDLGLSAHFSYVAIDVDSSTGYVLDANANAVRQALAVLGDGWMVETNLICEDDSNYMEARPFPDTVSAIIDDSRRMQFERQEKSFQSGCYISLTYVPSGQLGKALSKFMVVDEKGKKENDLEKEKKYFESVIEQFMTHFEKITTSGKVERLVGDKLVEFLNRCITGYSRKLITPNVGYFLDSFLSQEWISGADVKVGSSYVRVITIEDAPESTYPAILDELNYLGFNYRWSSRIIPLSRASSNSYLKKIQSQWSNKAVGLIGTIKLSMGLHHKMDEAAEERKIQTSEAVKLNNLREVSYGFMTSCVVLMNENKDFLEESVSIVVKVIEALGFKARSEVFNASEAYLGSIPCHGGYNIRKPLVDSNYAAHAIPTSSVWQGSTTSPNPFLPPNSPPLMMVKTQGSRKFNFNIHVGDVGHFIMLGPTGMGKSTLLGLIGCQWLRYPMARVIAFDKDHSNRIWIKSVGGDYMDLADNARFSPFSLLAASPEGSTAFDNELSFLTDWLCEICTLQKVVITPNHKISIRDALITLAHAGNQHLTMSLLIGNIQHSEVRPALQAFNSSAVNKLISGIEDNLLNKNVVGFETGDLLELNDSLYIPILRCIFHRLTHLFHDRRPTILLLEEAWSLLDHPIFETMLKNWLLTLRKFNVAVGFISQNIDHVTGSAIGDTIKESCPSKIFLPNPSINDPTIKEKYLAFGLNEQQIYILCNAIPKQDYYLTTPIGNRLFELDLNPLTLSFIGVSKKEDIDKFNTIHDMSNSKWINKWLSYRGLNEWCRYEEKYY